MAHSCNGGYVLSFRALFARSGRILFLVGRPGSDNYSRTTRMACTGGYSVIGSGPVISY